MEVEVSYVWLELEVDGNKYLVGGVSYIYEEDFPKWFRDVDKADIDLFGFLDSSIDEYLIDEDEEPPAVYRDDDGVWIVDFQPAEEKRIPLLQEHVKRVFFEFIFCDEWGSDVYNFVTGEYSSSEDLKEHPQEKLHGNDLGWLMEYGLE